MNEEEEIVRKDKLDHPNCGYSISTSKSCSTRDGIFVCETLKKINRMCPNERPVTVYSNKIKTDGKGVDNNDDDLMLSPFDLFKELSKSGFPTPIERIPKQIPRLPVEDDIDSGFKFQFGGNGLDDSENGIFKGLLNKFGFGKKKGDGPEPPKPPTGSDNNGQPKPPSGRRVGPSEDI